MISEFHKPQISASTIILENMEVKLKQTIPPLKYP